MKIENGTGCRLYTFNEYELNQHDRGLLQEFADNIIKHLDFLTRHGYTDDQWEEICISKGDVEDLIKRLLKERGKCK